MNFFVGQSRFLLLAAICIAAIFGGCKKNDSTPTSPPPTSTHASGTYTGVLADSGQSGTISLNVLSASEAFSKAAGIATVDSIIGTVTLGTSSLTITGNYNTSNDSLYLSGNSGGVRFSFAGTFSTGILQGSWSDSQGDAGNFAAASGTSSAIVLYIGVTDSSNGHPQAQLDFAVKGSTLIGVALIAGQRELITGTVAGNAITLYYSLNSLKTQIGTGTFDSTHVSASGSYNIPGVDSGTWTVINSADLPPPVHASGAYTGVIAGALQSGTLTLNVSAARGQTAVTVSGSVVFNSATTSLNGSYSLSNDSLYLTGSANGTTFSFAGMYSVGVFGGAWTISTGDSGDFGAVTGSGRRVSTYLGVAYGTGEPLDFVISGSLLAGAASISPSLPRRQFFSGSVSGSNITMVSASGNSSVTIGTGSIAPGRGTASGNYNIPGLDSGIWAVTLTN
jgi:hypothetical protein